MIRMTRRDLIAGGTAAVSTYVLGHYFQLQAQRIANFGAPINGLRNKAGELVFSKARVMVPNIEHNFWMDDARMNAAPAAMKGAFQNARRPEWAVQFDMDAKAAAETRLKVLNMIVNDRMMAGGFHFPFPAIGRIERMGSGFDFKPVA